MENEIVKYGMFVLAVIAVRFHVCAQTLHKHYIQKIEGTQLEFSMEAIPEGVFKMGSNLSKHTDEKPVHKVEVEPFWISTYEVTWDLFEPFVYKNLEKKIEIDGKVENTIDAITRPTKPYLDMAFGMGKSGYPAICMTQYNAIQFCKWLYTRTGVFYRLPTEAEWEYACRAGSTTIYYFGDDVEKLEQYAWYKSNSNNKTAPVGKKKPNAWGLFDMIGNVAEWTYDQYEPDFYSKLSDGVSKNPIAVATKLYPHSIRGGSYDSEPDELRSAARMASNPEWKQLDPQVPKSDWWFPEAPFIGFRIVRPLKAPSTKEIMEYYNRKPIKDY